MGAACQELRQYEPEHDCTNMADAFARLNFGIRNDTCSSGPQETHLPDVAVRSIAAYLLQNEPPGHALVHLLAFCGVCRQWRSVAREVNPGVCIGFDVLENTFCNRSTIQRFRRLNMAQKEEVFYAVAKLLTGMSLKLVEQSPPG